MTAESLPRWAKGLKRNGTYFEGYVGDIEELLEDHKRDTITTWGIRRSNQGIDKENELGSKVNFSLTCVLCDFTLLNYYRDLELDGVIVEYHLRIAPFKYCGKKSENANLEPITLKRGKEYQTVLTFKVQENWAALLVLKFVSTDYIQSMLHQLMNVRGENSEMPKKKILVRSSKHS